MRTLLRSPGAFARSLVYAALVPCLSYAASARAAEGDAASAEAAFNAGKERLAQQDYAHACPLFADSFKADPATGTLLALAICH